jgi:hypothetical protein
MSPKVQRLIDEVRDLSPEERSEFDQLLSSSEADEPDELDDEDRARLHEALERSMAEFERGEGIPAEKVLAELGIPIKW